MIFYLLGFAITLTTIFGIVHSQTARGKLQLQNLYTWSSVTIQQQLQQYNLFGIQNNPDDDEIIGVLEITVDQIEATNLPRNQWVEKIAEVQDENSNIQNTDNEVSSSSTPHSSQDSENDDNVLAAINASLQRLSTAASSGRINGAQLYKILVQETLMHEKNARARDNEVQNHNPSSSVTIDEIKEEQSETVDDSEKPKMYFGEKPLEYIAHQQ